MTETRIRWDDKTPGNGDVSHVACIGYAGTVEEAAFIIYTPDVMHADWLLSVRLTPGSTFLYAGSPDELKAEAERWLEEFVTSLGAVFPDEPDESAAFQLSEARDVLARWDAEPGGAIMFGREKVLADQVRVLLAIVASEPVPPHPEEEN